MQTTIDGYFAEGCGRCAKFATPQCKVHPWAEVLQALRQLALASGLTETVKWGMPCYTADGTNVAMVSAFTEHCVLSFFQGALLTDPDGLLEAPGPNSRQVRRFSATSAADVRDHERELAALLQQAIAVAQRGDRVPAVAPDTSPWPDELRDAFASDPALEAAFTALTPGRQRGYLLHFTQAAQSATRARRIAQAVPAILAGKGRQD